METVFKDNTSVVLLDAIYLGNYASYSPHECPAYKTISDTFVSLKFPEDLDFVEGYYVMKVNVTTPRLNQKQYDILHSLFNTAITQHVQVYTSLNYVYEMDADMIDDTVDFQDGLRLEVEFTISKLQRSPVSKWASEGNDE